MKNLNIQLKFLLLSALIVIMVLLLGLVANTKSQTILSDYEKSIKITQTQEQLLRIVGESLQTGQALRNIHINPNDKVAIDNLNKAISELSEMMQNLQQSNPAIHNDLLDTYKIFSENTRTLHKQSLTHHKLTREQLLENTALWRSFKKLLLKQTANVTVATQQSEKDFIVMMHTATTQMIIGQFAALLIIMIIFYLVNHQIILSVKMTRDGLLKFFDYLNKKSDRAETIPLNSKDEFGEMAHIINHNIMIIQEGLVKDAMMMKDTLHVARQVQEGYLNEKITVIPNNPQLQELQHTFNTMFDSLNDHIASLLTVIKSYTNNDFTVRIHNKNLNGEMEVLINGVNTLGDAMDKTLSQNFESGLNLKYQAMVLKNFVEQLSHASNEQAASLEETSSALEQITSNIGSNTDKASTMAIRANEARSATQEGEQLATQTVRSMDEIVQATTSINEAVAIIENIAFQTNILSLNAAVEAATAGEAGKGFAVVAQEVRSLANKSAEAAKTIKQLTNEAKNKANSGSEISAKMIEGFRKIAFKINETTDLVNDVAYANKEQMHGIEQINDAVVQLDHMTQENADMSNDTDAVSSQVSILAQALTEDAMQKEFTNKESIIRAYHQRELEMIAKSEKKSSLHKNMHYRQAITKATKNSRQHTQSTVRSSNNGDERWESF
ncbi:MAG: methyl-accepting chemotaxis protein [Campylobacterales bacterium]|nr:methyl-accepting chemotaxis protein [Campylobacterales bacterium]